MLEQHENRPGMEKQSQPVQSKNRPSNPEIPNDSKENVMNLRSSLLALARLAGGTSFADAQTAPLRDSVVIHNNPSIMITYEVRMNGGPWTTHTLRPGTKTAHFSKTHLALPPRVEVRFND